MGATHTPHADKIRWHKVGDPKKGASLKAKGFSDATAEADTACAWDPQSSCRRSRLQRQAVGADMAGPPHRRREWLPGRKLKGWRPSLRILPGGLAR